MLKTKKANLSSVKFSVHYGSVLCFVRAMKVYLDLITMEDVPEIRCPKKMGFVHRPKSSHHLLLVLTLYHGC